jgi:hypothetical protein
MKTRKGFVSNSSSSSFIVKADKINKKQEELLIKNNYIETWGTSSYNISTEDEYNEHHKSFSKEKNKKSWYNVMGKAYTYFKDINPQDNFKFLIDNKIPFNATYHYGQYTIIYDGKDTILWLPNLGVLYEMCCCETLKELNSEIKKLKMTVKEFIDGRFV